MRKIHHAPFSFFFVLLLLAWLPAVASAQSAILEWDPTTDSSVAGYRLYYGTRSGQYTVQVDVGNNTTHDVSGLDLSLDYYFAVQAYTTAGDTSELSNEARLAAAVPPGTTTISSLTPSGASPFLVRRPVTWTAAAVSTQGAVEYKFVRLNAAGQWVVAQDYGPARSFTWTPEWTDQGPGQAVQVWARTVGSAAVYEAWVGASYAVSGLPVQLTADRDFPSPPGQPITWTATVAGAGASALEYRFIFVNHATGKWSVIREYAPSNEVTWVPASKGTYTLQAWVRHVGSTAPYDVWGPSDPVIIGGAPLEVTRLDVDSTLPATTGTPLTWTARVKGGTTAPVEYQFVLYSSKSGWTIVRPYTTSRTYTWTPTWGDDARYAMQVWVRNGGSTRDYDAWRGGGYFDVNRADIHITTPARFPVPPGTPVTWTASVPDDSVSLEYRYVLYDQGTGVWTEARPYSVDPAFTWTAPGSGTYLFQVWARQPGSAEPYELWRGTEYLQVGSTPATVESLTPSVSLPGRVGDPITWTATARGGTSAPLQYRFVLYTEGTGWTALREWGPDNTITWTPTAGHLGQNALQVWVRSATSTAAYEGWLGSGFFAVQP